MKSRKPEPRRIIVGLISIIFIIIMWGKKDIATFYGTLPTEELLPVILTSVAVTLIKILIIAAAVFVFKWSIGKINKRKEKGQ